MATAAQPRVKTNLPDPRLGTIADLIESHMDSQGLTEDEKNVKVALFSSMVDAEIAKNGRTAKHS
jgi:helix-turn-helix protein